MLLVVGAAALATAVRASGTHAGRGAARECASRGFAHLPIGFCRAAVAGRELAAVVRRIGDTALAPPLRWAHVRLKCLRDDTLPSSRDTAAAQVAARPFERAAISRRCEATPTALQVGIAAAGDPGADVAGAFENGRCTTTSSHVQKRVVPPGVRTSRRGKVCTPAHDEPRHTQIAGWPRNTP
jgi:hypothetical protein